MEFKSSRQLRTTVTKHALKAYVAGPFTSKYHICVVRLFFLDRVSNKNINNKKFTGTFLEQNPNVVCFFSCIRALLERKTSKEEPTTKQGQQQ